MKNQVLSLLGALAVAFACSHASVSHAQGASAPAAASTSSLKDSLKQFENMQVPGVAGGLAKGWTCRDPEDGKRMRVVDITNGAKMNKVPSSVAALNDTTTPTEKLMTCARY
jgi:hypothetical protein